MNSSVSPSSKFRNAVGTRYLKALFFEETGADKSTVVYTLKDQDHEGFPSLYRLYMETNDPTEYRFATAYLDGWDHWEILTKCSWFSPYVERWRKELQLRLASSALARIMSEAKTNSRESFTANKYLLERGWMPKEDRKTGRPSKQAVREAAHEIASQAKQVNSDFDRILKVS
jgi:hypothetical protein